MEYPVRTGEHNDILHGFCPYCSKMYPLEEDGPRPEKPGDRPRTLIDLPTTCKRCGSPMDIKKAKIFADKVAAEV